VGPWYNAWGGSLYELDVPQGTAQWHLSIPADGQYTIQVWLPDAPGAAGWTKNARYQMVSGGNVVASANLDQSSATGGDQWHTIFNGAALTAASSPVLTISNAGSGPLIANAVYITSAARYNVRVAIERRKSRSRSSTAQASAAAPGRVTPIAVLWAGQFLARSPHSPPWNRANAWARFSDMIRMPAPRASTCRVLRRLKLPTRQTSR